MRKCCTLPLTPFPSLSLAVALSVAVAVPCTERNFRQWPEKPRKMPHAK